MFLNFLNQEEKQVFLKLAHYVARSDSDFSEKQKEIIQTYCLEMQIEDIDFKEDEFNLEETLQLVQSSRSQKVILLEIMALIFSDNIFHKEEEKIINQMLKAFEIDSNISKLYSEWSKSILSLIEQGKLLLEL